MQPPFDIAADLDTPVSAFRKLEPFSPRFLLESVEGGERLARYSFIGFGDSVDLRIDDAGPTLGGERLPRPESARELLDVFRRALAAAPQPGAGVEGLPFHGGLVGAAGYDLVRYFEQLPDRAPPVPGLPIAAYCAPRSMLVFDHVTRRVALLHDGTESERVSLRREVIRALRGALPPVPAVTRHEAPRASIERADYLDLVRRAQGHIADGDIYQLVLSIRFAGRCDIDPFEVYRALRLINPSPYVYYCRFGDIAVVGSSPEGLAKLQGRRAFLRPIAGTRPRGSDAAGDDAFRQELLADPKEAAEHVMLVDLARNDLGRVAVPGSIEVNPYRSVERYSHVMHLVSGVEGVLQPGSDAFDLFAAAFPAGTVVGAPKVRAMELIDELEPIRRGLYAGSVGYFGHGGMDQAIAIRTLVFHDGEYSYQAGAGIVSDSKPEAEYDEVRAKSAVLERALALAEEGL